ncbi:phage tail protein [Paenibacillus kobensis]|uniref:phage tail protein n=1 Tax=Paenibacillus kobensis TaxID=59841 RepID=UPI0013E2A3AF|nr:phage tail protein [Paenibacillus kobensis]
MSVLDRTEFHYHIIRSKQRWSEGLLHQLVWDDGESGIRIQSANDYATELTVDAASLLPAGGVVTDVAQGPHGMLLMMDETSRKVYAYNPVTGRLDRPEGVLYVQDAGMKLSRSPGFVYVLENTGETSVRLCAYAEATGQPVWTAGDESPFAASGPPADWSPYDVTADGDGFCYVTQAEGAPVAVFDPGGRFVRWIGGQNESGTAGLRLTAAVSAAGKLYVLDAEAKSLACYSAEGELNWRAPMLGDTNPVSIAVDDSDVVYIGEREPSVGLQVPMIHLYRGDSGEPIGPLTTYRGAADRIVFSRNNLYLFNRAAQKVTLLLRQPALYRDSGSPISKGEYVSRSFDSTEEAIRWHKLALDRDIPDNTLIRVSYLVSDSREFLIDQSRRNLDDYIADTAVRASDKAAALQQLPWSETTVSPRDMLIRAEPGRYLWIRIQLFGSDKDTPMLRGLRVDFPRLSYLRYMPAVYQEDPASRDLLERFLSLIETFMTELDGKIAASPRWLDVDAASGDYLRWLATWIGIAVDPGWPEHKLRSLIKGMPDIHRMRGTKEGLERIVQLYTQELPIIVENYRLQDIVDPEAKQAFVELFGDDPYRFSVLLMPKQLSGLAELETIKRMIAHNQPAHTVADVTWLQPWIYLGGYTFMGVNTVLTHPSARYDDESIMDRDTMLMDETPFGQLDVRSGLGADTRLI